MRRWRASLSRGAWVAGLLTCLSGAVPTEASFAPRTVGVLLQGNEFLPATIRARVGDTLRFVNGSGGPHNVAFERDSIAQAARAQLAQAMGGEKLGPLSGPLLLDPDETYLIVVPSLPAGRYPLYCLPHQMNMRGALIVVP